MDKISHILRAVIREVESRERGYRSCSPSARLVENDRPITNRMVEARPAAAGPEAARSNRSARLRIRLLMRDRAPKEPICPLGTKRAGPSLICKPQRLGSDYERNYVFIATPSVTLAGNKLCVGIAKIGLD